MYACHISKMCPQGYIIVMCQEYIIVMCVVLSHIKKIRFTRTGQKISLAFGGRGNLVKKFDFEQETSEIVSTFY